MHAPALPLRRWIGQSYSAMLDLLLPPRCVGCSCDMQASSDGVLLCPDCRTNLPLIDWPVCPRCAAPVPTTDGVELACSHCREDKLRFTRTVSLGSYEGRLRRLIMRMKIDRSDLIARTLAELAWQEVGDQLAAIKVDVVTAVPMHPWRRWQRRTNPPQTIAQRLAEKLGVPAAAGMLRLNNNVPVQVGLSRSARFRNVAGEMSVGKSHHLESARVLLVDDILTTGATCSEASRVLRRAGAAEIAVFVLARTPSGV